MKLSTRGRYAVSAMFDLACHGNGDPISASVISKRSGIPLSYLEQILLRLKKGGLVKTLKGPSGGYILSKVPSKVSIGKIIEVADGPVALADCVSSKCSKTGCCSTSKLWKTLSAKVSSVLNASTLQDLCKENRK